MVRKMQRVEAAAEGSKGYGGGVSTGTEIKGRQEQE
jgi:hypothetical protein